MPLGGDGSVYFEESGDSNTLLDFRQAEARKRPISQANDTAPR